MYFVSIIIANFNGEHYLKTCLESVLKSSYSRFEIIIVDDGSTDSSLEIIERIKRKDKRLSLIRNSQNLGAAASRNKAIRKACGGIIVFLDNDTEVDKNWLGELIISLDKDEKNGAAQALLLDFKRRDQIQMGGGLLIPQVGWLFPFYQSESYQRIGGTLKEREIIAISAALAVKRQALDETGGFDEKEALYTEDLDFCWRLWIAGYYIKLAPRAIVYHHTKTIEERSLMNAKSYDIYFNLAKNSFRSIMKNYELIRVLQFLPLSIAINLFRGIIVVFKRRNFSALRGTLMALIWTLLNLKDTLYLRSIIQRDRRVTDTQIKDLIFIQENLLQIYRSLFMKRRL